MKKASSQSSGRGGASKKAAAPKKAAVPSKSSAPNKAASNSRTSAAVATKKSVTSKKSAAPSKSSAPATRTAGAGRSTATKSVAAKSAGTPSKSANNTRNTASNNRPATSANSRNASSNTRGAASKAATSRSSAAPSPARSRSKAPATPREGLQDVLKDCLKDIYYAEKQLAKALKKMSKAATNEQLKDAFMTHMEQTQEQIEMLSGAFEELGMKIQAKRCPAMDGLLEEGNEHMEEMERGAALDAALIVGAQKVEHYEIAAYGSMRTFANDLGFAQAAGIFEDILKQESETDELLTQIAKTVNREALMDGEEIETEKEEKEMEDDASDDKSASDDMEKETTKGEEN